MSTCRHVAWILALLLWPPAAGAAPELPEVDCRACVVTDVRGHVLWGRDEAASLPNASSTKIVTALVTLEGASPGEEVRVSQQAAATPDGYVGFESGEVLSVSDLLHALLMSSANDAAIALAEHVSGSVDAFVREMNETADELGASATNFETPHGLDAPGHVSSAADLALFAAALLGEPELAGIVATPTYTLASGTDLENSNPLLEAYDGATGVKTGTTALAGQVLVASAERSEATVIAVVLGSDDARADAAALLDYGFELVARRAPAAVARRFSRGIVGSARGLASALGAS